MADEVLTAEGSEAVESLRKYVDWYDEPLPNHRAAACLAIIDRLTAKVRAVESELTAAEMRERAEACLDARAAALDRQASECIKDYPREDKSDGHNAAAWRDRDYFRCRSIEAREYAAAIRALPLTKEAAK